MSYRLHLVLWVSCLCLAPARSQPGVPIEVAVYNTVQATWDAMPVGPGTGPRRWTGLSVGLVTFDTMTFSGHWGQADLARGRIANDHTRYRIGSISKVITATLLAQMDDDPSLNLNLSDLISAHLPAGMPASPVQAATITLRHLATHTSGLPGAPITMDRFNGCSPARLRSDFINTPLSGFGTFQYSNLGFAVLGQCLEGAGGAPYDSLVRTRVLAPLGMTNTLPSSNPADAAGMPDLAVGYGADSITPAQVWFTDALNPAGGMVSTLSDLAKFLTLQHKAYSFGQNLPIAAASLQRLHQGITWFVTGLPSGRTLVWHNGGVGGFHSYIGFCPQTQRGVILLANSESSWNGLNTLGGNLLTLVADTTSWKEYARNRAVVRIDAQLRGSASVSPTGSPSTATVGATSAHLPPPVQELLAREGTPVRVISQMLDEERIRLLLHFDSGKTEELLLSNGDTQSGGAADWSMEVPGKLTAATLTKPSDPAPPLPDAREVPASSQVLDKLAAAIRVGSMADAQALFLPEPWNSGLPEKLLLDLASDLESIDTQVNDDGRGRLVVRRSSGGWHTLVCSFDPATSLISRLDLAESTETTPPEEKAAAASTPSSLEELVDALIAYVDTRDGRAIQLLWSPKLADTPEAAAQINTVLERASTLGDRQNYSVDELADTYAVMTLLYQDKQSLVLRVDLDGGTPPRILGLALVD